MCSSCRQVANGALDAPHPAPYPPLHQPPPCRVAPRRARPPHLRRLLHLRLQQGNGAHSLRHAHVPLPLARCQRRGGLHVRPARTPRTGAHARTCLLARSHNRAQPACAQAHGNAPGQSRARSPPQGPVAAPAGAPGTIATGRSAPPPARGTAPGPCPGLQWWWWWWWWSVCEEGGGWKCVQKRKQQARTPSSASLRAGDSDTG